MTKNYYPKGIPHDIIMKNNNGNYVYPFLSEELKNDENNIINIEVTKEENNCLMFGRFLNYIEKSNKITFKLKDEKLLLKKEDINELQLQYKKIITSFNNQKKYSSIKLLIDEYIRLMIMYDDNLKKIIYFVKIKSAGKNLKFKYKTILATIYYKDFFQNNDSNLFLIENMKKSLFFELELKNDKKLNKIEEIEALEKYNFEKIYKDFLNEIPKEILFRMGIKENIDLDNVFNGLNVKELQDTIKKREKRLSSMKQEENLSIG